MIAIENARFAAVLAELGPDLVPTTAVSVDFLFDDDMPVRVTLHPGEQDVIVDAFAFDASGLFGEVRASMARLMLNLNGLALKGRPFALGVTPTDLVAVTVRIPLRVGGEALADAMRYASAQAADMRGIFAALVRADAGITTYRL